MSERLSSIDPKVLISDYWGGHGNHDNCDGTDGQLPERGVIVEGDPGFRTLLGQMALERLGRNAIRKFAVKQEQTPRLTLDKGDQFDAKNYEEGTVLHFKEEELLIENGESSFEEGDYWGMVHWIRLGAKERLRVTSPSRAVLLYYPAPPKFNFLNFSSPSYLTSFSVGNVEHLREDQTETLRRTTSVEIW